MWLFNILGFVFIIWAMWYYYKQGQQEAEDERAGIVKEEEKPKSLSRRIFGIDNSASNTNIVIFMVIYGWIILNFIFWSNADFITSYYPRKGFSKNLEFDLLFDNFKEWRAHYNGYKFLFFGLIPFVVLELCRQKLQKNTNLLTSD